MGRMVVFFWTVTMSVFELNPTSRPTKTFVWSAFSNVIQSVFAHEAVVAKGEEDRCEKLLQHF